MPCPRAPAPPERGALAGVLDLPRPVGNRLGPRGGMAAHAPRILLVDDEQSVQKLLAFPLRKDGYEVVSAVDGQEALDRFGEAAFDLGVLDVMLPRHDGFELCRRLRARSAVPIIMLTAKTEEFDKVLGLELGADDY